MEELKYHDGFLPVCLDLIVFNLLVFPEGSNHLNNPAWIKNYKN